MDTKEKILEVALKQFNELGTDAVTVRSIAQEVGISHGNLCYHFPNTDAIILALYQKIVGEMNEQTAQALEPSSELELLLRIGERGFRILYRYKFLMLDFVRIMRRIPQIQAAYRELMKFRQQQFLQLFQNMVAKGWFVPAPVPHHYENLAERMLVNADSWIPHAEIHFDGTPEEAIRHYYRIYISEFLPLLTKKGQSLYKELFPQFS
ncbi:MAG: TetR family transcriptional regulator [Saprospiraceae bacterium]|nr:TetR family transcriptional regulator [Saprospiraceae bacterium]